MTPAASMINNPLRVTCMQMNMLLILAAYGIAAEKSQPAGVFYIFA